MLSRRRRVTDAAADASDDGRGVPDAPPEQVRVQIAPGDPLLAHFQAAGEAVDVDALELDSPALRELKAAGVKLAVPLVSQGELIGVLSLGPRLSEL
ncbi:MAG: phosphoserine phosphatase RsbU/P, partial [Solirubrobacteraceae bacterium]|nr:phosphoserine phosphatase RsbU/P [Solirubrobacteraceae bacterium]